MSKPLVYVHELSVGNVENLNVFTVLNKVHYVNMVHSHLYQLFQQV